MEGMEREGPNLLLNQGPSELCYATVTMTPAARLMLSISDDGLT